MAAVWVLIAAVIVRFVPNKWGRVVLFGVLVGIPFWELPIGYYNFQKLCMEQAKLQVFEKIPPQDSVCVENLDSVLYGGLVRAGYTRIEVTGGSDNANHYIASGRVFMTNRKQVKSSYCVAFENNIALPWRVSRSDTSIVRVSNDRAVARQSVFYWWGMWWQQAAGPVLGRGGRCFDDPYHPFVALRQGAG